jgi:plastocyanin
MLLGKKLVLTLAFALSILALVFVGQASAAIHDVSIIDFAFVPKNDTILAGDSVRWTNNGSFAHTTTSNTGIWDSGNLSSGQFFIFQFTSPGLFPYECSIHPFMTASILVQSTDVRDETGSRERPSEFALFQNRPNPFNQTTKIEFAVAKPGLVSLTVYDILGKKVRTIASQQLTPGHKSGLWDGKDERGREVASGVYFYRLRAGDLTETRKMLLLK